MKVIQRGHLYELDHRDGNNTSKIQFVNKEKGYEQEGVTTQEILRVLIDRTHYCHNCLPHEVNAKIIHHLRMALVLHESRALEMEVAKGQLKPEQIVVGENKHFAFDIETPGPYEETELASVPEIGTLGQPNHRCGA